MSEQPQQSQSRSIKGIVKQVLSGDTIVIRGVPKGGPPPEKTITLSFITAPKLAKRGSQVTDDEPFAWEAREFLRKRLVGQNVNCVIDKVQNREYGIVYHGPDSATGENINELLVKEGLVNVRGENIKQPSPELLRLLELQDQAKKDRKGKWDDSVNLDEHKRKITWAVDNMMAFVEKMEGRPIKAVIEHVRDGSTVRAFLILPEFVYVTLMMSGIRSPQYKLDSEGKPDLHVKVEHVDEAKFFTESRLLQQEVEVILESFNGPNFVGSILHPKGNIAEELLKVGLARCVDWSIAKMKKSDVERLRQAEKIAKEKKLKMWKDWKPPPPISDKEFVGTVMEVINSDALMVKLPNGTLKKIFLASVRPPRPQTEGQENRQPGKMSRQLYDVPWMFEAREFLRKKLIGKKVNVSVDYLQPIRDNMAEKCCCTVTISNVNVAETLVSKGFATVVRYRQNDDQRASAYDSLLAAENKALKGLKGLHAKKVDTPTHRINDYSGEPAKAKGLLPHIQRLPRVEALVEYVASGSRMRVLIPKESSLVTFLLSGIDIKCPREDGVNNEELAVQFTREKVMQREVEIKVEGSDRAGNFIGWLWCEGMNLAVALVEQGLAKVHISGENSEYSKLFMNAKNMAKSNGLWKFSEAEEQHDLIEEDRTPDRKIDQKEVMVVVTSGVTFFCQFVSEEAKLNALQEKINREMASNPPLPGAYTPKKGDMCAAKFAFDNQWYRAKIEKVSGGKVSVHYVDYGNKADVLATECAHLPPSVDHKDERPCARQYTLICVTPCNDIDYQKEQENQFYLEACSKKLLLNEELNHAGVLYATLVDPETKEDISKRLIADGLLLVDKRRERKFQKLVSDYMEAEEEAKKKRLNVWEYGDVREDDDKEFGMGR